MAAESYAWLIGLPGISFLLIELFQNKAILFEAVFPENGSLFMYACFFALVSVEWI